MPRVDYFPYWVHAEFSASFSLAASSGRGLALFCEPLLAWYIRLQDRGFLHVCGNLCTSPFLVVHSAISFNGCNLLVSIMGRPAFTLWAYIIWRLCRSCLVPNCACVRVCVSETRHLKDAGRDARRVSSIRKRPSG